MAGDGDGRGARVTGAGAQRRSAATVHAAGALVWRASGKHLEVLLVHRPRYDDWSIPKGKLDPGEALPACAVREVAEETGEQVVLGQPLPGVRYRLTDGRVKQCHYWAARVVAPSHPAVLARGEVPRCDPREVDEARWVRASHAREMLTRHADRAPLDALVDHWEDGTLDTRAFVVLRHARARKRSAWPGGETDRPLTATGVQDAEGVISTLAAYGVADVFTSPWERCRATVAPYAVAARLGVVPVPEITEAANAKRPSGAARTVDRLLAAFRSRRKEAERDGARRDTDTDLAHADLAHAGEKVDDGAVLCTHRPVLPTVLEALSARAPRRVSSRFPDTNPYLRTAEMLVSHVLPRHRRGVRVHAVELRRPSA
ncbi:NUDIX domain-containing protein [Litorihabitans aurantiacus]|uniref:ADP-ribose pyrophosphatase n=1 Tax=Litorihabitans aurantiacus TaxID=1930061 RepID=A0AA37XCK7_9MICO|nr:NUDIX domain-containing protein [Litorihabitans aurantiacus]GMA30256.1 ADP-ribose pyrophosphatase [Litorihabitans aurantiacus]